MNTPLEVLVEQLAPEPLVDWVVLDQEQVQHLRAHAASIERNRVRCCMTHPPLNEADKKNRM